MNFILRTWGLGCVLQKTNDTVSPPPPDHCLSCRFWAPSIHLLDFDLCVITAKQSLSREGAALWHVTYCTQSLNSGRQRVAMVTCPTVKINQVKRVIENTFG